MSNPASVNRQKRLGQFYTGLPLARLLAAFCDLKPSTSVIDPMAGSGDLLVACAELGVSQRNLYGVELDPKAFGSLKKRVRSKNILNGNAFCPKIYAHFKKKNWDLVIANPPYVRYQSGGQASFDDLTIPSAEEIRRGLLNFINERNITGGPEGEFLAVLANSYSGLSDLAVPSWLLCASLVQEGGRLALIVPESWLNRNYASVINYMLLRSFTIECMITDDHAVWFPGAQVKTTLVIARKNPLRASGINIPHYEYLKIGLSGGASKGGEPIAMLGVSESEFVKRASKTNPTCEIEFGGLVKISYGNSSTICEKISANAGALPWLKKVEDPGRNLENFGVIPDALKPWLNQRHAKGALIPLSQIGASVAQGLRTGANKFFYVTHQSRQGPFERVKSELFNNLIFDVPQSLLAVVIRKQSDLSEQKYWQPNNESKGRVLIINEPLGRDHPAACHSGLLGYVDKAAVLKYGAAGKTIPNLSAVCSNVKTDRKSGENLREWYMLPKLARRHYPEILIPRVVGQRLKTYAICKTNVVVDANFITIRINKASKFPPAAVLAVLNSSWARAVIENTAAVMGAGALKVEATHLRNFPMPDFDHASLLALERLGQEIDTSPGANLTEINQLVVGAILGRRPKKSDLHRLEEIATAAEQRRLSHKQYKHD